MMNRLDFYDLERGIYCGTELVVGVSFGTAVAPNTESIDLSHQVQGNRKVIQLREVWA
jgi:hypothetical protein